MLDKNGGTITMPQAVKCCCSGGMLLPLLQPVTGKQKGLYGDTEVWGDMYEITWKCSYCNRKISTDDAKTIRKA